MILTLVLPELSCLPCQSYYCLFLCKSILLKELRWVLANNGLYMFDHEEAEMKRNSLYESALTQGEFLPEVVAYYYKQWDNYNMPFHAHNQVEIMYVIEGHCCV